MTEPLGAKNPRIKRLRRLVTRRRARSQERAFVVEGPVLVTEVLESDLTVQELYLEAGTEPDLAALARHHDVAVFETAPGSLQGALDTAAPRPVAAVVELGPQPDPGDLGPHDWADGPLLVLADLADPGNVGTLIRTAEAAGFAAVLVTGDSVDVYNPKVVRAAAGALFRLPVISLTWDNTTALCRSHQIPVLATVVSAEGYGREVADIDHTDLTGAAIVLGNEAHGLSPEQVADADQLITIPLAGPTESLNVAAAGAVVCFASWQQRRTSRNSLDTSSPNRQVVTDD